MAAQLKLTKKVWPTVAAALSEANDTVGNSIYSSPWGFPSSSVRVTMELPALLTFTGKATLMHQEASASPMSPHHTETDASPL